MMGPNPNASTHKARFAAFEGATQLRNRFPTTPGCPHVGPTGLAPVEPQIHHYAHRSMSAQ